MSKVKSEYDDLDKYENSLETIYYYKKILRFYIIHMVQQLYTNMVINNIL